MATAKQIQAIREQYPGLALTDKALKDITQIYKDAALEIQTGLNSLSTDFQKKRATVVLSQVRQILKDVDKETAKWVEKSMPNFYLLGAVSADIDVDKLKGKLSKDVLATLPTASGFKSEAFFKVHTGQINAIALSTYNDFANGIKLTMVNAERFIADAERAAIKGQLAQKTIEGATLTERTAAVKTVLQNAGVTALTDRGGKNWRLDTYAQMLARTKQTEAYNTATGMRMLEFGFDLAQISTHGATDSCGKWEGRIISLSGAHSDHPSLDEVEGSGDHIFGPNCRHVFTPYHESLAGKL